MVLPPQAVMQSDWECGTEPIAWRCKWMQPAVVTHEVYHCGGDLDLLGTFVMALMGNLYKRPQLDTIQRLTRSHTSGRLCDD